MALWQEDIAELKDDIEKSITISKPPSGGKRVTNLYISSDGKFIIEYEDTPEE